ncbi:drug/metabolite transporter (DMT)-like permease [Sinomonas atrocyanea]|uniref:DMT family transporter n=1 Tax=Sinomonas atrocyanea TaxID=37927 RepID=UPI002786B71C|nr:DMT family transporter [Sinomonas atrocyanea]MDP9884311.1 drug/metabolite transporter (DMT)-like permease [Sinomonas atrocyanea]
MVPLLVVLGVLGVSASGPLIAGTLAGTSVTALAIAFWRNAIASLVMAAPVAVRSPRQFRLLTRRDLLWSSLAGVALAFHFVCFIVSLTLTSVAASTALVCLQSGWIAVFSVLRGRKLPVPVLAGLGLAFLGVVAITGLDLGFSHEAVLGDLLAVAGGILAGLYTMAGGKARQTMGTGTYTALCYGVCAALVAVMALATGERLIGFEPAGWVWILAITAAAQLVGHTAFNHLVATLSPLVVSMFILLEIPGAALLAAVFLGEVLPGGTYAGLGLILAGLAVVVLGQRRTRREPRTAPELGAD